MIPCYNEADCIRQCLESVFDNDYESDLVEVLVVEGGSNDGTRELLADLQSNHANLRVLENPERNIPRALNIGIEEADGEIIVRMDSHSIYDKRYIATCVESLQKWGAHNVGGRWTMRPRLDTLGGRAICFACSSMLGAGNAYYKLRKLWTNEPALNERAWGITVAYFCCWKSVFSEIGPFNENLYRSEDGNFAARLRLHGLKTLFDPEIECFYLQRSKVHQFFTHMYRNGHWVFRPYQFTTLSSFSLRHFTPAIFSICLLASTAAVFLGSWLPLAVTAALYSGVNLFYSLIISLRERDPRYFPLLVYVFLGMHLFHGIGSVAGLIQLIIGRLRKPGAFQHSHTPRPRDAA